MSKHSSWQAYAKDVGPRLDGYLPAIRLPVVEQWLHQAYWMFSYVQEYFNEQVSTNKAVVKNLYPLLIEQQDILRGLIYAQEAILLAASSLQARTAFELRCAIAFIVENAEPEKYADRFARYADVEKFMYQTGSPDAPQLTEVEKAAIRQKCPEWFKSDGTLKSRLNWTGDEATNSIKKIAEAVGLLDDYQRAYAVSSKITHGSPLVRNMYANFKGPGIVSIASPHLCAMQVMMGAMHCLKSLIDLGVFAGVALPEADLLEHLGNAPLL